MTELNEVKSWLKNLSVVESWVKLESALAIIITAGVLAFSLSLTLVTNDKLSMWWILWAPLTVVAVGAAGWAVGREIYWRSGSGDKVGIAYEGFRVPMQDWIEVRKQLTTLLKNAPALRQVVSTRIIPPMNDKDIVAFLAKYRFSVVFSLKVSPRANGEKGNIYNVNLTVDIREGVSKSLVAFTGQQIYRALNQKNDALSLKDALHFRAHAAIEAIFHAMAMYYIATKNWATASLLLQDIDNRLAATHEKKKEPRKTLRSIDAQVLAVSSQFPARKPLGEEELLAGFKMCQVAVERYADEFPWVLNRQARNAFFLRRLPLALELTERALVLEVGDKFCMVNSVLNAAVLHLLLLNWNNAAVYFRQAFEDDTIYRFDWGDLVTFADVAAESGYEHAKYIRALYRKVYAKDPLPPVLEKEVAAWLDADKSRSPLRSLYMGKLPKIYTRLGADQKKGSQEKRRGRGRR